MVKITVKVLLMFLLMVAGTSAYATKIDVSTDRTKVQENESFTLEYSSDASVDDEPDFAPIEKNFSIISRSQSSNIQFIQGRLDRQSTWVLVLMPKATGKFKIPAINFGSDKSESITIEVTKATVSKNSNEDLVYIEAFADTKSTYTQSQIIYTLRIYHAVRFRNASLSDLELSDKDATIEKLEENKKYTKFVNGRRFQVFEKRFAIFPQTVGTLTIKPTILDVQYIEAMRTLRNKRITSDEIIVDVKPVPQIIQNKNLSYWLPASDVTLEEKWSGNTDNLQVGEPLTRTVTITATGLLSSALPVLSVNTPIKELKQYPDQPTLDNKITETGFVGQRQEKIAYIPSQPGKVTLPPLEIFWWDTGKNEMKKAMLPSREFRVAGAGAESAGNTGTQPGADSTEPETTGASGSKTSPDTNSSMAENGAGTGNIWYWVSMCLLLLWVATIGLWISSRKGSVSNTQAESVQNGEAVFSGDAVKKVKTACQHNDPQALKEALINWGRVVWKDSPPNSLGHIAERVNDQLAKELLRLNTALYKPGAAQWDKSALLASFEKCLEEQRKKEKTEGSKIKPLFRIASSQ